MAKKAAEKIQFASSSWQDWFLGQLEKDEGFDKDGKTLPKAIGLLRLAQRAIGNVTYSTHMAKCATEQDVSATVMVDVTIHVREDVQAAIEGMPEYLVAQGVADAGRANTEMPFGLHAAATAHTRALGRAIKQTLFLNVHCAEEILGNIDVANAPASLTNANGISSTKVKSIKNMLKRLGLNEKFQIDSLGDTFDKVISDGSLGVEKANKFLKNLNEMQNSDIPEKYLA